MAVIAAVSHKGGAGRSVTLANIAYQLNQNDNRNTCIVDLDLASPTLGSVFGVKGLEGGVGDWGTPDRPLSVYDLLVYDSNEPAVRPGPSCYVELKSHASEDLREKLKEQPSLYFLPGLKGVGDWSEQIQDLGTKLKTVLESLQDQDFQHILLDVRSGSSDVLDALSLLHHNTGLIDLVLLHIKWTIQHIEGLDSLITHSTMAGFPQDILKVVRTAYWEPEELVSQGIELRKGMEIHDEIKRRMKRIELNGSGIALEGSRDIIATIPDSPLLRIKEGIVTADDGRCFERFRGLAYRITKNILE